MGRAGTGPGAGDVRYQAVGQVADAARKIEALPPEARALNLERLAKAGLTAVKAIEEAAKAENTYHDLIGGFAATVRDQLHTIPNIPNTNFAAAQVRDYIRSLQKGKKTEALSEALGDLDATRAILGAPPMASGLTRDEYNAFELRAILKYMPDIHEKRSIVHRSREIFGMAKRNAIKMTAETAGLKQKAGGEWVPVWQIDV